VAKWADYAITRVRFNDKHTHIDRVKIREDKGDSLGDEEERARSQIVSAIDSGTTFVSAFENNGKWQKGQEVFVVEIHGERYMKTVRDDTKKDNVDNLPEF
jgi:hypothetical protein